MTQYNKDKLLDIINDINWRISRIEGNTIIMSRGEWKFVECLLLEEINKM